MACDVSTWYRMFVGAVKLVRGHSTELYSRLQLGSTRTRSGKARCCIQVCSWDLLGPGVVSAGFMDLTLL